MNSLINLWPACSSIIFPTEAEQDNISHLAYGTWMVDFILWENESRAFLGKYLNDPCVPWRHNRREMMAIAGNPVAKWIAKIMQRLDVGCKLCKTAREQGDANTENLPEETYGPGHISSAFCDRMATTFTYL